MTQTAADTPTQSSTSIKEMALAFFRHRRLFVGTVLLVFGLTVAYTFLTTKQYASEMNILVQNNRLDAVITPERSNGAFPPSAVTDEQLNSEMQVLTSTDVADETIDPGWTSVPISTHTEAQIHDHDAAVLKFSKSINVTIAQHSNIINVVYTDSSPRRAHDMLARMLTIFLSRQRLMQEPGDAVSFFATATDRAKADLDAAQQKFAAFQQQQQMVNLPDKEVQLSRQISDLQDQLHTAEAQIAEAEGRVNATSAVLQSTPVRQSTQQRNVPNELSMEQLSVMLTELKNRRTELLTKYPPTERLVVELDHKIAATSEALDNAQRNNAVESTTDVNPVWQQMNTGLAQSKTDAVALRSRRDHIASQVASLQAELARVESVAVEFTTLQQTVAQTQNNYTLYMQKRDEADLDNAMNLHHLLNVAVVEQPTYSATPVKPQVKTSLFMGLFTGIFLAAIIVFFAEMGRTTFAHAHEIELVSAHPVLATFPLDPLRSPTSLHAPRNGKRPSSGSVRVPLPPLPPRERPAPPAPAPVVESAPARPQPAPAETEFAAIARAVAEAAPPPAPAPPAPKPERPVMPARTAPPPAQILTPPAEPALTEPAPPAVEPTPAPIPKPAWAQEPPLSTEHPPTRTPRAFIPHPEPPRPAPTPEQISGMKPVWAQEPDLKTAHPPALTPRSFIPHPEEYASTVRQAAASALPPPPPAPTPEQISGMKPAWAHEPDLSTEHQPTLTPRSFIPHPEEYASTIRQAAPAPPTPVVDRPAPMQPPPPVRQSPDFRASLTEPGTARANADRDRVRISRADLIRESAAAAGRQRISSSTHPVAPPPSPATPFWTADAPRQTAPAAHPAWLDEPPLQMHREEPPRTLIPAEGEYVPRTGPASTAPSRQFIPAAPPSYPPPQREASRTDFPPAAPRRPSSGQVPIGFSEPPTARSSVEIDRIRRSGFVKRHEPDILSSQHPDSGARKVVSSAPEAAYDQQGKLEYVTYTFNKVDFDRRKRND